MLMEVASKSDVVGLGVKLEVIEEAVLPQEVQHCHRVEVILSSRVLSAWGSL